MKVAIRHLIRTVAKTMSLVFAIALISGCDNSSNGAEANLGSSPSSSKLSDIQPWDKVLGDPNAPITMFEYASVTCGHCADFHKSIFKKIKENYVETGKVKVVLREIATQPRDAALSGFIMARCLPEERYFPMIDALFRSQGLWAFGGDFYNSLKKIAADVGMSGEQFDACLRNEDEQKRIKNVEDYAFEKVKINGTPSFVINGKFYKDIFVGINTKKQEEKSWQNFKEIFDKLAEEG